MSELEQLCQEPVFRHFYQICQIPHGSGNEQALSSYLLNWAKVQGLEATQDAAGNVLIRKPPAPGYEAAPPVMLQAHLDMVCEKADGVEHDFLRDPIPWVLEDGLLSTGGKTTLGADDGIGIALALTLLEDRELPGPELEVLFTTMEEEDLSGAAGFDYSQVHARYLINLDHVNDRQILCGSCGGMRADLQIPILSEPVPEGWKSYRLRVSGLRGGHSGEDIHRGRGNANILLARLMMALQERFSYRIGEIRGGTFRLAIPREAEAVLWMPPASAGTALSCLKSMREIMRAELPATAGNLKIELTETMAEPWATEVDRIINAMVLVPDGIFQMNELFPGVVDTSDNLGEVYLDRHTLRFVLEIRSAGESRGDYLLKRMERLAGLFGGSCHADQRYPSWLYRPESELRRICGETYRELFEEEPEFLLVHAGLEVGCIVRERPELDAVSVGPNCRDFHSPSESLEITSVRKTEQFLRAVLKNMNQSMC